MNSNFKEVKPKQDRVCKICLKTIPKGTLCVTINPVNIPRYWVHKECYSYKKSMLAAIEEAEDDLLSVSFGDEGASRYYQDRLNEAVGSYEQAFDEKY